MPYQQKTLQLLIENARDYAIVVLDTRGRVVIWNTGAENLLGWRESEIIGQPTSIFFTPEDRAADAPEEELRTAREQGRAEDERWHLRKDGSRFWGSGLVFPILDGSLQGYLKIFRDLTERRQMQEAVRAERKRLQATLDAAAVGTWLVDAATNRVIGDATLRGFFEVTEEEAANATAETYISRAHPEDAPLVTAALQHSMATGEKFDVTYRVMLSGGGWRWLDVRGQAAFDTEGRFIHLYGMIMDVTKREQAEHARALAQAQAEHDRRLLDAVLDALPTGVIIADPTGRLVHSNAASERIWGTKVVAADVEGYRAYAGYRHDTGRRLEPQEWAMSRALQGQLCPGDLVEIEPSAGGERRIIINSAAPVRDAAGEIIGGVVAEVDVTAQIHAEEALRQSEEKYRLLLASVDQGFCHCEIIMDTEGQPVDYLFLEVNPAFEEMTGLVDATGRTIRELTPNIEDYWAQTYGRVVATGEPIRFQQGSEALGRIFDVYAARVAPGRFVVLFTDISAQRRAEQERQRQLMEIEALNVRLARAMQETHHRVKNNLQVIAALVEMQTEELGNGAAVQRIKQHVRSLATIHDLLTRQAKQDQNTLVVGADAVLENLIPMLQATSGNRHIRADIAPVSLSVQKATSLALLVSECVSNAIKHARGKVEVTLKVDDNTACLEVCDDGGGFPPDFDPRKAANTGLELIDSTARWDLRGEVRYENRSEGGARVVVTFPAGTQDIDTG